MTETGIIPVLAAPGFDPGAGRVELSMPEGLTLAEIVRAAIPGASAADHARCRVALVTAAGRTIIQPALWHAVRPKPGVRVVIRVIPGKNALRSVLSIVVSIAAVALGTMFGAPFAAALGWGSSAGAIAAGGALITLGVNLIGHLLINALVPPAKPDTEQRNSYSISGWRNRFDPDGAVPVVMGQIRYAPPFAASSYTEIDGDWQYVRALFLFGEGEIDLSDFRIGETSIADYDDVEIEVRHGLPGDLPVSIYPRQIVEESIAVDLTRPLQRDDLGVVIEGAPAEETPVVRTTGRDADSASVIIAFPAGLFRLDGEHKRNHTVRVRIEQRRVEADEWQLLTTLNITASKAEGFYRQHSWRFPSRGRWQVRLTMMTDESEDSTIQARTVWAALQTLRPEYPIDYDRPLALVAVRVRATHQLSGSLDSFSAMARRVCLDWDHVAETWVRRATSNPASLYRHALQGSANPKPVADSGLDLGQLQDWHDFCRLKGLAYDRVLDQTGTTLRDVLTEIAAAGRATPHHDGLRWGVVIDRPSGLIVDHVGPRNSWGFSCRRTYAEQPHALIIKFQDRTADYKEAQRIVRRPGYDGPIELTEVLALPGKTDPDEIHREAIRRFYEAAHRPDVYQVTQDGAARVATRGDTLALSHDVLSRIQRVARVRAAIGNLIELDETVTIAPGQSYGIRVRAGIDEADSIGTSSVRIVAAEPGETRILTLDGSGPVPEPGDLISFGIAGQETMQVVVTRIEATEDMCQILRCVDAAPQIDTLTDATEIPAWSGRVGAEIADNLLQPATPRFASIVSGASGTGNPGRIEYLITPGPGAISTARYIVQHRLAGAPDWIDIDLPAANGGGSIAGYSQGDEVQLRAIAVSAADVDGPASAVVTIVVGAGDAGIPAALDEAAISLTALPGGALIQVGTGADENTTRIQLYRSRSATLDRETDASGQPLEVSPLQTWSLSVGDLTRNNLVAGSGWVAAGGWAIAGGAASHSPGSASTLSHAIDAVAGRWYRLGYTVSGRTAGSVTPRLTGGSMRPGSVVSIDGHHVDRIQAVTGNDNVDLSADAAFDGDVSDILLYLETAACLDPGPHYLWLEPRNSDGVPGPVSGPFTLEVI